MGESRLAGFCEGQEFNCDMEEILWHRRESRRKQRKQTSFYSHRSLLSTRKGWSTGVMQILGDPIDRQIWVTQQIPRFIVLLQSENQHSNTPPLHYSGLRFNFYGTAISL